MTHTYSVKGMTCSGCEASVKSKLLTVPNVLSVDVSRADNTASIEMKKHITLSTLQSALGGESGKYQITTTDHNETTEQAKSWLTTYKPVLLIFVYILAVSFLIQLKAEKFNWMLWMTHFMAGFFLVFSFFKLLNIKSFAESYSMYDVIAKRWTAWGYLYAFIELILGLAYLTGFNPLLTNAITFVVMTISIIGVLQSVLSKRKIKCACLGDVFNLPMTTITVIEDGLMILMSAVMILIMSY